MPFTAPLDRNSRSRCVTPFQHQTFLDPLLDPPVLRTISLHANRFQVQISFRNPDACLQCNRVGMHIACMQSRLCRVRERDGPMGVHTHIPIFVMHARRSPRSAPWDRLECITEIGKRSCQSSWRCMQCRVCMPVNSRFANKKLVCSECVSECETEEE
jgi:hypothetical protein